MTSVVSGSKKPCTPAFSPRGPWLHAVPLYGLSFLRQCGNCFTGVPVEGKVTETDKLHMERKEGFQCGGGGGGRRANGQGEFSPQSLLPFVVHSLPSAHSHLCDPCTHPLAVSLCGSGTHVPSFPFTLDSKDGPCYSSSDDSTLSLVPLSFCAKEP